MAAGQMDIAILFGVLVQMQRNFVIFHQLFISSHESILTTIYASDKHDQAD